MTSGLPRIAIIGAGGYIFPLKLVRDIAAFPALRSAEFALYDIALDRAERVLADVELLIETHRLPATAFATDDPRRALSGSDAVVCAFRVGGHDAYRADIEIPREYGIDQPIGDTQGPGGIFRGLRSIEALRPLLEMMRELCPGAPLIQYANPMSINCWAVRLLGVDTVGLCHSVQHTSRLLAAELGIPYEEVIYDCAGVNHTAWFTTFRRGEEDLLPRLRETMWRLHGPDGLPDDAYEDRMYDTERVRTELMELTGYFHTESSHHASEYWPWFRRTPEDVRHYLPYRYDSYELYSRVPERNEEVLAQIVNEELRPSEEYCAFILDSLFTGTPRVIYGNVENAGAITNLPSDACVEVACLVDANGLRPIHYGALPPACAALNAVQVNLHRLVVEGALSHDRELIHAAAAIDPLTSGTLRLPQIREMVDRMFEAELPWLPGFASASSLRFPSARRS